MRRRAVPAAARSCAAAVALAVLLAACGGGPEEEAPPSPAPTAALAPTLEPMPAGTVTAAADGWQVYRNEAVGFAVEYPPEWRLGYEGPYRYDRSGLIPAVGLATHPIEHPLALPPDGVWVWVVRYNRLEQALSPAEAATRGYRGLADFFEDLYASAGAPGEVQTEQTTVAGRRAVRLRAGWPPPAGDEIYLFTVSYLVLHGDALYVIEAVAQTPEAYEAHRAVVDQVVERFRFLGG